MSPEGKELDYFGSALSTMAISLLLYSVIPFALLCWYLRARGAGPVFRWLGLQLLIVAPLELAALIMDQCNIGNLWLYDFYLPVEMVIVLAIAVQGLPPVARSAITGGVLVGYLLCYVQDISSGPILKAALASWSILFTALVFAPLYTYKLFKLAQSDDRTLWRIPEFWLYLSFLFYFGGLVPYIGLYNYLARHEHAAMDDLSVIISTLCFVRYALTAVACLVVPRKRTVPIWP